MPLLQITQTRVESQPNRFAVAMELKDDKQQPLKASTEFTFEVTDQDRSDVRWYLEDYLQYPLEPAPTIARRIEDRMEKIGEELFDHLFSSRDAARLWAKLEESLPDTRIEVITGAQEATAIPWELVRDPGTKMYVALRAKSYVRSHPESVTRMNVPQMQGGGKIRILLVTCRPAGRNDAPFRSVSSRILKGLDEAAREVFQLDVLRPATFDALEKTLTDAKNAGTPYHIVHFDGHGTYGEVVNGGAGTFDSTKFATTGKRGYLVFEGGTNNMDLRDGEEIGNLMVRTGTPVLVLNACQSAYAEAPDQPPPPDAQADIHSAVRAFGSLAQTVMDTGVAGVVAMRYSVYVVTAAQFVAELYRALVQGQSLGEAVSRGRMNLDAKKERTIAYDPVELHDWMVPVVYESAPLRLFTPQPKPSLDNVTISIGGSDAAPTTREIPDNLPHTPDIGFFGRDETLLALDRAFDTDKVVLLWALAGSGKTTTAAEFARWYALTGGLRGGAVLFTSFQHHHPLSKVFGDFGAMFGSRYSWRGKPWFTLPDHDKEHDEKQQAVLEFLATYPVLWIWDNVEPVGGFPEGTESKWSADEQRELADFLRAAKAGRAKFLLTSRRDERRWLSDLPKRIDVPPMPMLERVALTRALVERQGRKLTDVKDWRPLLRYTGGNPLTLTVLVNQALRRGLTTREKLDAFVAQLRSGEAAIEDEDEEQGRTKSLAASLKYGFESGFSENEQKILALLHLFQGFVNVNSLVVMGVPDQEWTLDAVKGISRETGIPLLDRAADAGLLTRVGNGLYTIHPALPWYFKRLFDAHYGGEEARLRAQRAYVEAIGYWGNEYHQQANVGNPNVIVMLEAEEDNLLASRRLALDHGWHSGVIQTMQGLRVLYGRGGRRSEWAGLVNEITPVFCDDITDQPRAGVEENVWIIIIDYRVRLAREVRRTDEAERLQRVRIAVDRRRAEAALKLDPAMLDGDGRNRIRTLAVSTEALGNIQRERNIAECIKLYEETVELSRRIGDRAEESVAAFNLGRAYMELPAERNLDKSEYWYQRDLELQPPNDYFNRSKSLAQLGAVAYERFRAARAAGKPEEEMSKHLNVALNFYQQSVQLLPQDAVDVLAAVYGALANIYAAGGQIEPAREYYEKSLQNDEKQGNLYRAAGTRYNVGMMLAQNARLPDALEYAKSALRGFQSVYNADADVQLAMGLIAAIEKAMKK